MSRPSTLASMAMTAMAAVLLTGCTRPPPAVRPTPAPDPATLAAALQARHTAVGALNARARATSWLGGERVRATVLILAARDGRLRLEAEISLQGTVATLAVDGPRFALLDAQHNQLSRGPACPRNVASLVRIPLRPTEVAAILLGDVALEPAAGEGQTVTWDAARGADVWTVPTVGGRARLAFHGDGAGRTLVAVSQETAGGRPLWRTAYEDFAEVGAGGGVSLPRTIRFAEGAQSFDDGVEIRFRDRTLNPDLRPGDFTLTAGPGITVKEVGCGEP